MNSSPLKRIFWFGNFFLLVYAIAAIFYSPERIFLDGTYYFFHVVQSENFRVEHQRFILIASQVLTVIGTKLHLPLHTLLILNSVNPALYLWIFFLLSIYWLKNEAMAWSLLLSAVCGIYFLWFCPMYEVWYGCVLLIFFAGVLEKKFYGTISEKIIFAAILITLLFSYPLLFVGVIFFSLSHFLREKKISLSLLLIYVACFALWLSWKIIFISDYEEGKVSYPLSQIGTAVRANILSASAIKNLLTFLITTYPEALLAFVIATLFLFVNKQKLQSVLLFLFTGGFILLINLTQQQPWHHTNYFERMYLLLIPLCFVPFLQHDYRASRFKWMIEFALAGIIGLRFMQIIAHSKEYAHHNKEVAALILRAEKNSGSKFTVNFVKYPELSTLDEWSLPMESLIFSSLKNPDRSITISWKADIENPLVQQQLDETKFRLRLDEILPDDRLNQKYFHLEHGNYHELNW